MTFDSNMLAIVLIVIALIAVGVWIAWGRPGPRQEPQQFATIAVMTTVLVTVTLLFFSAFSGAVFADST